ncbi:RHS repeat-associated core domain-containing protein [Streptomyces sp. NPDC006798]|uniref:RHS repeat-associated core domain-containing protein n=1 Tax=Streptomyces sp. NPDC006798 TaxID=3155462 RepID=UPI00340C3899
MTVVVTGLCMVLAGTTVQGVAFAAGETGRTARPGVQDVPDPVRVGAAKSLPRPVNPAAKAAVDRLDPAVWPKGGTREVQVSADSTKPAPVTVGGLPVLVGAPKSRNPGTPSARSAPGETGPARVRVEVLPTARAADLGAGAVLRVQRADGSRSPAKVRLTVDYSAFAEGFGGSYGARLRLVQLPACAAVAEPGSRACPAPPKALATVNDAEARTVSAEVAATPATLGGASAATNRTAPLFALTPGASSSQGNYGATGLSPSASWSVAPSTGGFTWSYPMRTVPVPGGLDPTVGLSYSSQSTDGRTSNTNNQGSWIGEGFSYEPGYVERSYKPCAEDGHNTSAEQCFAFDNATMMLNGSSTRIILDDTTGKWRLADPDGSTVEKVGGISGGHWKITTPDGKQHFFGRSQLPGFTAGKEETHSAWTAPVFGDDPGEPCHNADFSKAHCQQVWRWNLDYVKDVHGNVISYYYGKETNHYSLNGKTDVNGTPYHRGGYLKRIDYGQRDGQVYTTQAPARVVFGVGERCLSGAPFDCSESNRTKANAAHWPDVPVDRECKAGVKCSADQRSVTFFTTKLLTSVVTQMRTGTTGYQDVDAWKFRHSFLDNGDASQALWLSSIEHEGRVGAVAKMPLLELFGTQLDNRVDIDGDNMSPFRRFRLATVLNETGGQLDINYKPAECTVPTLPQPGHSTKRCYPVMWAGPGHVEPVKDWFHKYVVGEVIQTDRTGGGEKMVTRYDYQGPAGWRHSKPDGITPENMLTWGDWQGYGKVSVTSGPENGRRSRTDHTYFQGLHGDKLPGGGTRVAQVVDSGGTTHADDEDYIGFELESAVYDNGKITNKVVKHPWKHHTATQTKPWATTRATLVQPRLTRGFTALASGGWRETKSTITYDTAVPSGRITESEDLGHVVHATATPQEKADAAKDDTCIRTWYADNTDEPNLLDSVKRVEKVSVACDAAVDRSKQVISDTRNFYDGQAAHGAVPTRGLVTKVERLASHNGTTATYQTTAENRYDAYGRAEYATSPATGAATTVFTMVNGLTTQTRVTNAKGHVSSTDFDPAWGQTRGHTDPNGKRQDLTHDALGRVSHIWLEDRRKSVETPSTKFTYQVRRDQPVAIKRELLERDGTYADDYTLYDSLLRPRQRQAEGPGTTRLVADTLYDGHGRVTTSYDTYQATGAPTSSLVTPSLGDIPTMYRHEFDDTGRPTATVFASNGVEQWRSTNKHEGDRSHVIPPQGGVATTSLTDTAGRVTELRQYQSGVPGTAGPTAYTSTRYSYTPAGHLATVTDSANNTWSFTYDQRGRETRSVDPDAGTTELTYDDADRVTATRHVERDKTISSTYDVLGRPLFTYDGPVSANKKLTETRYDSAGMLGRAFASLSYVPGTNEFFGSVVQSTDSFYRPLQTAYSVPASQGTGLTGVYVFTNTYNTDGTQSTAGLPAAGALPAESLAYGYDTLQRPVSLTGAATYATNTIWSPTSKPLQYEQSTGTKKVWNTFEYETGTQRLTRALVDVYGSTGGAAKKTAYSYDQVGNVLSMADTGSGSATPDVQCFAYDQNKLLSEAWTPATDTTGAQGSGTVGTTNPLQGSRPSACATDPGATALGGPAPYWKSYRTDAIGNRTQDIIRDVTGDRSKDVTRTFTYGENGAGPHAVTKVTEQTPTGPAMSRYTYDAAGNMTTRTIGGDTDTLTWGSTGKVDKISRPDDVTTPDKNEASETAFLYDAGGNRIQRKDPTGTTVYLPGTELHLPTGTTTATATRYYQHLGQTVAVRGNDGKVTFTASDHHGTGDLAVDATTGATTYRRSDPYGNPRGAGPGTWPGSKGFVGGTIDKSTGLTNLGARQYDPALGKFISVDPIIDYSNAQQMNGYAYANNSPVTHSDPTGLLTDVCREGIAHCSHYGGKTTYRKNNNKKSAPPESEAELNNWRAKNDQVQAKKSIQKTIDKMSDQIAEIAGVEAVKDCLANPGVGICLKAAGEIATLFVGTGVKFLVKGKRVAKVLKLLPDLKNNINDVRNADKRAKKAKKELDEERRTLGNCLTQKHSFLPDTLILMADGSRKKIKDIRLGDKILTTDPKTGKNVAREVVRTITTKDDKDFVTLRLDTSRGKQTLISTVNHPFWVPEQQKWVEASQLKPGTALHTAQGERAQLAAALSFEKRQQTFDLTIDGIHAYYALAGAVSLLVHNDNCGTIVPSLVKFSQDEISRTFSTGMTVDHVASGLRSGWIKPGNIPPIRLVVRDGNLFTLDNRRLAAFQKARMPVPFRMASPKEAASESWKFTTVTNGDSIVVRETGEVWSP